MEYKILDIKKPFSGEIVQSLGNSEYVIKINDREHNLRILNIDAKGIEFVLDQKYHKAKYLQSTTAQMNIVVDGVPITLNMHHNLDEIVYKNSGGAQTGGEGGQLNLQSQIPGKVVSVAASEGSAVKKGDVVCVLESMKMQISIKSHKDGTIKAIKVKQGDSVAKNDIIAEIE
jgi:biotin carboxyl carrier protein